MCALDRTVASALCYPSFDCWLSLTFKLVKLTLDHLPSGGNLENSGLTEKFASLQSLGLNGVGLSTLKHLPLLPKLRKVTSWFFCYPDDPSWNLQITDSHQRWIAYQLPASNSHTLACRTISSRTLLPWIVWFVLILFISHSPPLPSSPLLSNTPQKGLKALRSLNVESNPVANDSSYRKHLFSLIPNLVYVDEEDRYALD